MKQLTFIFTLWVSLIFSQQNVTLKQTTRTYNIAAPDLIPIGLEHAVTPNQLTWGLMKRSVLPWTSGMTFNYRHPQRVQVWMFNTLIDLSVAFLDTHKVIRSITDLESYPKMMDPKRPVNSVKDIERYPDGDPIRQFFKGRGVTSSDTTHYALEMNKGWFHNSGVKVNDVVLWDVKKPNGFVLKTIDIDEYVPKDTLLSLITFEKELPVAVYLPNEIEDFDLIFLDHKKDVIKTFTMLSGGKFLLPNKPVAYTINPIKYLIIAPAGWVEFTQITKGVNLSF